MKQQHEYTDWQAHYEVCPRCRPYQPCPVGVELQRRERKDGGR